MKYIGNYLDWITSHRIIEHLTSCQGDATPVWQPTRWTGNPTLEKFKELARPDITTTSYVHGIKSPGVYAYKLKIIEKNGSVRFTNTIKIEATESIGIFKVIKQAQQPVIVNATEPYDYKVVDINGRVIQIGKASAGTKSIDIRNYPTGIYNLKLINQHEERVERFMNK